MEPLEVLVTDPTGNTVFISRAICDGEGLPLDLPSIYDNCLVVITKPALIIESNNSEIRYYYRSIDWNNTLLIKTEAEENNWHATQCYVNPTNAFMAGLLQTGKLIKSNL